MGGHEKRLKPTLREEELGAILVACHSFLLIEQGRNDRDVRHRQYWEPYGPTEKSFGLRPEYILHKLPSVIEMIGLPWDSPVFAMQHPDRNNRDEVDYFYYHKH